ncbi:hypothetical protein [Catellatospora sichuanensis]|uniref:hypothetical protein n=1 Tax=Catellatospora sichuanensis TaxID=1969805 RepID=UPI0016433130|nr:hypothetical protein [Catellatospora sichuanensis]
MSEQQLREAFAAAQAMPDGPAQHTALDGAIRAADAAGEAKLAFEFRHESIEKFVFGGDDRRAFLAFSLSLAAYDRDPEIGGPGTEHLILWQFKWIVNALPEFPDVPLDRTYAVLEDMRARYLRGGHSLHAVHQARWQIALHVGDLDEAAAAYHDMITAKQDSLANCSVCVPSAQAWYLLTLNRPEDAIAVAAPFADSWCRTQPERIRTNLMLAHLYTGDLRKAAELHRAAYRAMRTERLHFSALGTHLTFLGRSGNALRGLELLERHLPWLDGTTSPHDVLVFTAPAVLVLNRLAEAGHADTAVQGRPGPDGRRPATTVAALRAELTALVEQLAARFDARNGTTNQSELARQRMTAPQLADSVPLSVLDTAGRRTRQRIAGVQEQIAAHTVAGDAAAAALARLDAALLLRDHSDTETRYGAAEEAALALERVGLAAPLLRARELLWQLYRSGGQHRDQAMVVLDLLLAEPSLTASRRGQLLDESARLFWGDDRAERSVLAADQHGMAGDRLAELRSLSDAVSSARHAVWAPAEQVLARADAIAAAPPADADPALWDTACGRLNLIAAWWYDSEDRDDEALARAELAEQCRDGVLRGGAAAFTGWRLLGRDRPAEAEQHARRGLDGADEDDTRRLHAVLAVSLRAQGDEAGADALVKAHDLQAWELDDDGYDYDDSEDEDD